jgi:hypothetical protein
MYYTHVQYSVASKRTGPLHIWLLKAWTDEIYRSTDVCVSVFRYRCIACIS